MANKNKKNNIDELVENTGIIEETTKEIVKEEPLYNTDTKNKILNVIFSNNDFKHMRSNIDEFIPKFKIFIDNGYSKSKRYSFDNYVKRLAEGAIENQINRYLGKYD